MKKILALLILSLLVFITCIYAQPQQPQYRNNIPKIKDSTDYRFKNTLYMGCNFYTFQRVGLSGLYPTFYTINYKRRLSKIKHIYWELGWNYFLPNPGGLIYTSGSLPPYVDKLHIFNTLHLGIGKRLLNNALGISAGLNYKYGIESTLRYVRGVGYTEVDYITNTSGIHVSVNYQFIVGKSKRFVIEPIGRYEYYFSGVTSHYMVGLNAGYKFR